MNQEELYLFDLTGYLVIEDVLTQEEVTTATRPSTKTWIRYTFDLGINDWMVIPNTCAGNMAGVN